MDEFFQRKECLLIIDIEGSLSSFGDSIMKWLWLFLFGIIAPGLFVCEVIVIGYDELKFSHVAFTLLFSGIVAYLLKSDLAGESFFK